MNVGRRPQFDVVHSGWCSGSNHRRRFLSNNGDIFIIFDHDIDNLFGLRLLRRRGVDLIPDWSVHHNRVLFGFALDINRYLCRLRERVNKKAIYGGERWSVECSGALLDDPKVLPHRVRYEAAFDKDYRPLSELASDSAEAVEDPGEELEDRQDGHGDVSWTGAGVEECSDNRAEHDCNLWFE